MRANGTQQHREGFQVGHGRKRPFWRGCSCICQSCDQGSGATADLDAGMKPPVGDFEPGRLLDSPPQRMLARRRALGLDPRWCRPRRKLCFDMNLARRRGYRVGGSA